MNKEVPPVFAGGSAYSCTDRCSGVTVHLSGFGAVCVPSLNKTLLVSLARTFTFLLFSLFLHHQKKRKESTETVPSSAMVAPFSSFTVDFNIFSVMSLNPSLNADVRSKRLALPQFKGP